MYEIVIGRDETDRKALETKGTIPIAKHYVTIDKEKSLANRILLDVNRPHVVLVCGKRGSGKSYTLGVMTEGISNLPSDIKPNVSTLIFDTLGIFWTMKYPNYRDDTLLAEWDLEPTALKPKIFVPLGKFDEYQKKGIPVDAGFGIKPVEVSASQWAELFGVELLSPVGILVEQAVEIGREKFGGKLSVQNLIEIVNSSKDIKADDKDLVIARFEAVKKWGVFDENSPEISELLIGGETIVLDVSAYSEEESGNTIKSLVIGYICSKALKGRMLSRKTEEVELIKKGGALGIQDTTNQRAAPLLWIFIDEAHEFLPKEGKTLATDALVQLLREGRQPGISLVLATQQPGKIHTDVLTQSDIVLSHRLTARVDVTALNEIMQSYLPFEVQKYLDGLQRVKGAAILLDDTSEKIYPIRVQPRISWHGGEDPALIRGKVKKELFESFEKSVPNNSMPEVQ